MLSGFPLLKVLAYAKDDIKSVCKRKFGLLDEFLIRLSRILAAL